MPSAWVIGAPIMALLSSRFSLKSVMLFLAGLCILGNTLFTFSSRGSDRVAAITANFQATTSIGNLVSISSSNIP
ncbi:MFS transport protein AraJ [Klebsiella pneumoniae]|uniref:MFS transport protein AraJ n=1 Tax=Klebsiella pneumoniae TaxID=573 RepID=A0A2X3IXS5_KLEPN|nr:MFS transport protein AraJ [Klebsiella pneumoniae]